MTLPNKKVAKRIVGLDYGLKRIGLALSDETQIIASPYQKIETGKKIEATIKIVLAALKTIETTYQCEIAEIIIGLPLLMNGQIGFIADEVKNFAKQLSLFTSIPLRFWDERLSSVQADRALREGNMTRKKRAQVVDIVSAAIILQSYLDFKQQQHSFSHI